MRCDELVALFEVLSDILIAVSIPQGQGEVLERVWMRWVVPAALHDAGDS